MKISLNDLTRRFLLGENKQRSVLVYLQALKETLNSIHPRTQSDYRRLEVAKDHLNEIRRHARRLQERVTLLEEQLQILEEGKG
jgi:predicted  nucleic acid-binding Zn-ribbon protein